MKIKKSHNNKSNPFTVIPKSNDAFEKTIQEVIDPFIPQIINKDLRISIYRKDNFKFKLELDWKLYKLIFFNII